MLLLLALLAPAHADGLIGVDWVPLGRGDLTWTQEDRTTGLAVGEEDGLLVPALTAWGGWANAHFGLLGNFGMVRLSTTNHTEAQVARSVNGALRPGVDLRWWPRSRAMKKILPYGMVGAYGVIPTFTATNESWTEEEQAAVDEDTKANRGRVGGIGGRMGLGAEVAFEPGISLGVRWSVDGFRQQVLDAEGFTTSFWLRAEAALSLGFWF